MVEGIKDLSSIFLLLEENFSVSITNLKGELIYVNKKFCELTKYSEEELLGQHYSLLNPNYANKSYFFDKTNDLSNHKVSIQKIHAIAKDGSEYWVQTTIIPVLDDNDEITKFVAFDIDYTKAVLAERKYVKTQKDLDNIENALNQSTVVAITDRRGIITYVNDKFCELSKYTPEELLGQPHRIVNSGYHSKSFFKNMWKTIGNGIIWKGDVKNRAKDGSEYWVDTTIVPFLNSKGIPYQYISIRTDITSKKMAEKSLKIALKNDFQQTVKHLQNAIFKYKYNKDEKIIFTLIEGQIAKKLNVTAESVQNGLFHNSLSKNEMIELVGYLKAGLAGEAVQFEFNLFNYTFLFYLSPIFEDGIVVEVVGTATDISARKQAEKQVEHMAFYDYLTDLPNRRFFKIKVNEQIEKSLKDHTTFSIMFIDLDRFKNVNDSMGHSIGDQLLIAVGKRLEKCVRKGDIVARHGGDEFIILLASSEKAEAEAVASRIIDEMGQPFVFNEIEVFVSPSIGLTVFPNDGNSYETLTGNADSAMYLAKESGKNNYKFFTEALHQEIVEKTTLEMELRKAVSNNQFEIHYQPQFHLNSGKMTGVEALIRWNHPTEGMISPARFIPIAEESGLIIQIGQWVLETACRQLKKWQNDLLSLNQISVNVSIHQFKQANFVKQVTDILFKTGLSPECLNLEITESMTSDVNNCQLTLRELRNAGINVSIDDFGTGYSSLSYLSKFPITHLKIDQAFVQELSTSNKAIIKTIVSLAKNLNLIVIAEGVETETQANFLRNLDCDEVQGYFYSRPLPLSDIETLLQNAKV